MDGVIDPRKLMSERDVSDFCQTAEDFFKKVIEPNPLPHMAKPFTDFVSSPHTLYKLGLLLDGLKMGRSMVVLDFGAGTCWLSRFLNQMGCSTISVDPSPTALSLGKRLFDEYPIIGTYLRPPRFLHFDGRRLQLEDESVDRVVCFDTFHHIPNQAEVLREFFRVLKPFGTAGFSEPGMYHSESPQAQYEMRTYGVLESNIYIDEIRRLSLDTGFKKFYLKPLTHTGIDLEYSDYENIITGRTFPDGLLHQITFSLKHDTVFFLSKSDYSLDSRACAGLKHEISVEQREYLVEADEPFTLNLTISNTGSAVWLHENIDNIGVVYVGTHLYDENYRPIDVDFFRRTQFDADVPPGDVKHLAVTISLARKGTFILAVDLVADQVCWFESAGSTPALLKVTVS